MFFLKKKNIKKSCVSFVPFLRKQMSEKADTLMSEKVPIQIQASVLVPDLCRVLVAVNQMKYNTSVWPVTESVQRLKWSLQAVSANLWRVIPKQSH